MAVRPNRIAESHEDRGAFTVSFRGLSTVLPLELPGRGLLAPSRPGQALETLGRRWGRGGDQSSPGQGWAPGVGRPGGPAKWIPLPALRSWGRGVG